MKENKSLIDVIVKAAEDIKAVDVELFDVAKRSSIVDYFIVCSGNSSVHVESISRRIGDALSENKISYRIDGKKDSRWIVLDSGPVIVHVLGTAERTKYNLEQLWKNFTVVHY